MDLTWWQHASGEAKRSLKIRVTDLLRHLRKTHRHKFGHLQTFYRRYCQFTSRVREDEFECRPENGIQDADLCFEDGFVSFSEKFLMEGRKSKTLDSHTLEHSTHTYTLLIGSEYITSVDAHIREYDPNIKVTCVTCRAWDIFCQKLWEMFADEIKLHTSPLPVTEYVFDDAAGKKKKTKKKDKSKNAMLTKTLDLALISDVVENISGGQCQALKEVPPALDAATDPTEQEKQNDDVALISDVVENIFGGQCQALKEVPPALDAAATDPTEQEKQSDDVTAASQCTTQEASGHESNEDLVECSLKFKHTLETTCPDSRETLPWTVVSREKTRSWPRICSATANHACLPPKTDTTLKKGCARIAPQIYPKLYVKPSTPNQATASHTCAPLETSVTRTSKAHSMSTDIPDPLGCVYVQHQRNPRPHVHTNHVHHVHLQVSQAQVEGALAVLRMALRSQSAEQRKQVAKEVSCLHFDLFPVLENPSPAPHLNNNLTYSTDSVMFPVLGSRRPPVGTVTPFPPLHRMPSKLRLPPVQLPSMRSTSLPCTDEGQTEHTSAEEDSFFTFPFLAPDLFDDSRWSIESPSSSAELCSDEDCCCYDPNIPRSDPINIPAK
jgi:hypothetical protein